MLSQLVKVFNSECVEIARYLLQFLVYHRYYSYWDYLFLGLLVLGTATLNLPIADRLIIFTLSHDIVVEVIYRSQCIETCVSSKLMTCSHLICYESKDSFLLDIF